MFLSFIKQREPLCTLLELKQPYTLVRPPIKGPVIAPPLAVYSLTTVYIYLCNILIILAFFVKMFFVAARAESSSLRVLDFNP